MFKNTYWYVGKKLIRDCNTVFEKIGYVTLQNLRQILEVKVRIAKVNLS